MTSSSQNVSNPFGNLSTSFKVKADIDIGKFSRTEPTLLDELYRCKILLVQLSRSYFVTSCQKIHSKAKSIIQHLGPSYTVEEVIAVLTLEYEGVASSDVVLKDFYQLKQEQNGKVQVFSI